MRAGRREVRGRPDSGSADADGDGRLGAGLQQLLLFLSGAGDGQHTSVCT